MATVGNIEKKLSNMSSSIDERLGEIEKTLGLMWNANTLSRADGCAGAAD